MSRTKTTYPTFKEQTFTGKILRLATETQNTLVYNYPAIFQRYLDLNCKPGDLVTITLTNKAPKRTLEQNNYVWLYFSLISLSSGHTPKEIYRWAEGKFLSQGITEVFGDKVHKVKSAKELNRPEFCEWLMRIEEATEIPLPDCAPFLKPLTQDEYDEISEAQKLAYQKMKTKLFKIINKLNHVSAKIRK